MFGVGMRANIGEAYVYLQQNMRPDDRVFMFGFSRGAYTARALAGMLMKVGLMRPGAENLVPYAVGEYARNHQHWSEDDWAETEKFAETFSRRFDKKIAVPIAYMGLWDTVKAAGFFRWNVKWPYTRQLRNVAVVRHAVSIDEYRRIFHEYLVQPVPPTPVLDEAWFSGVHTDVGGTFKNKDGTESTELPGIALKWIVEGALESGILLHTTAYADHCTVTASDGASTPHRNGKAWILGTYRTRPIPTGARVHASVQQRLAVHPEFARAIAWRSGVGGRELDRTPQNIVM